MVGDMHLFQNDILNWTEIYTLRRGEKGTFPQDRRRCRRRGRRD